MKRFKIIFSLDVDVTLTEAHPSQTTACEAVNWKHGENADIISDHCDIVWHVTVMKCCHDSSHVFRDGMLRTCIINNSHLLTLSEYLFSQPRCLLVRACWLCDCWTATERLESGDWDDGCGHQPPQLRFERFVSTQSFFFLCKSELCQPSSYQIKTHGTLPCNKPLTPHLFQYVLMRVSQIWVVPSLTSE